MIPIEYVSMSDKTEILKEYCIVDYWNWVVNLLGLYRQSKKEFEMEEKKRKTMEKEELANIMVLEQNRLQNEKEKEQQKYGQVVTLSEFH